MYYGINKVSLRAVVCATISKWYYC